MPVVLVAPLGLIFYSGPGVHESWSNLIRDQVEVKFSSLLKVYKWMLRLFYINGIAIIATWNMVAFSLSELSDNKHKIWMKYCFEISNRNNKFVP